MTTPPPPHAQRPLPWLAAAGHYWTVAPVALHMLRAARADLARPVPWSTLAPDERLGAVRLSGVLHEPAGDGRALVVIVHGLGGDVGSHYVLAAARAALEAGFAALRLNLRGADGTGEALYHAGLTADLHAALASPALARYERLYLLGYSLGGHLALRCATEPLDPRVRAVASVCAPLDLRACVAAIDEPRRVFYRRYMLSSLHDLYATVARRRPVPIPPIEARRIRRIREWDERIIAPWFGFRSADQYYGDVSVAPRLARIALPTLIVAARHDPMIPEATLRPALERLGAPVDVRWIDHGGHVGFPASVALGLPGRSGLPSQLMAWLARHQ